MGFTAAWGKRETQRSSGVWHDLVWSLVEICCEPGAEGTSEVGDDVKNVVCMVRMGERKQ